MTPESLDAMLEWHAGFGIIMACGTVPATATERCPALARISREVASDEASLDRALSKGTQGSLAELRSPLWLDFSEASTTAAQRMLLRLNARRGTGRSNTGCVAIIQMPHGLKAFARDLCSDLWSMRSAPIVDFAGAEWKADQTSSLS